MKARDAIMAALLAAQATAAPAFWGKSDTMSVPRGRNQRQKRRDKRRIGKRAYR